MFRMRIFVPLITLCSLLLSPVSFGLTLQEGGLPTVSLTGVDVTLELSGALGPNGVLLLSEGPAQAQLVLHGMTQSHALTASFDIMDHSGKRRFFESVSVSVGNEGNRAAVDLSALGAGWYRLRYEVIDAESGVRVSTGSRDFVILNGRSAASDASRAESVSPFGVENSRLQEFEGELLRHLGADWILDAATPSWSEVQFLPGGPFIWRSRAEALELARDAGLIPVGNIGAAPAWVSSAGLKDDPYLTDFYRFVRMYTGEPGSEAFVSSVPVFHDVLDATAYDYVKQLKVTSAALQTTDGGTNKHILEVDAAGLDQISWLLAQGVQADVDTLLVRLPQLQDIPETYDWQQLSHLRREWNRNGGRASVWTVTANRSNLSSGAQNQVGARTSSVVLRLFGSPTQSETETSGLSLVASADAPEQAQWLVRSHVLQLAHGVERIFASPFSTGSSELRLFTGGTGAYPDTPQRPRPAIAAYATMAEQLTGSTYMGRLSMPADIWALAFSKHGEPVLVVWTTRPQATLELNNVNVPAVKIIDMMGAEHQVSVDGDRLVLPLDPSPQYVHGLGVGLLAQVLIDDFGERLGKIGNIPDLPSGVPTIGSLEDAVIQMATELWLQARGDAHDLINSVPTWFETVDKMLQLAAALVGDDPANRAALYELYDLLAVIAELGAVMGVEADPEAQMAQVMGTDALLAEAAYSLSEARPSDAALAPHTHKLLEIVRTWWKKTEGASNNARTAWAIVAREAAALAMLNAESEPWLTQNLFLLTRDTGLQRTHAGFSPYEPYFVGEELLLRLERALLDWLEADDATGTVVQPAKGLESDSNTFWNRDNDGWDELKLPVSAVNATGAEAVARIAVQAPSGWFWRVGDRLIDGSTGEAVEVTLPGEEGRGVETPLDVSLLVPYRAPLGRYEATLSLHSASGVVDPIKLSIHLDDAKTPPDEVPAPLAVPSSGPDTL